jgi:hypothetical protein
MRAFFLLAAIPLLFTAEVPGQDPQFDREVLFGTRYIYHLAYEDWTGHYGSTPDTSLTSAIRALGDLDLAGLGGDGSMDRLWNALSVVGPHELAGAWEHIGVEREVSRFDDVRVQLSHMDGGPAYMVLLPGVGLTYHPVDRALVTHGPDWRVVIDDLSLVLSPLPIATDALVDGELTEDDGVCAETVFAQVNGIAVPVATKSRFPNGDFSLHTYSYAILPEGSSPPLFPSQVFHLEVFDGHFMLARFELDFVGKPGSLEEIAVPLEPRTTLLVRPGTLPADRRRGVRGDVPDSWPKEIRAVVELSR